MVVLKGVSKSYPGRGKPALSDVSLHVAAGQFAFITGPSGAGKTTLLRLLFGAEFPSKGQVRVAGVDLGSVTPRKLPRLRRKVGVIFQDFKLMPGMSVFENVALTLRVNGGQGPGLITRVQEMLSEVGLGDKGWVPADTLSGGEQQRTAIARALVGGPPLLLADEPTGNLDPQNARQVMGLLKAAHQKGSAVLVATHDPDLLQMAPQARIIRLSQGRLETSP